MSDNEPAKTADPVQETVGQALQKARAGQELSLDQLAAELRIEPKQLLALEQDKFERIGVPVFVKGYLKQYGARLGLDYRDLLALYYRQGNLKEIDIRPSRTIKLRDERQITGWIVGGIVLAVIGVVIVVWWFSDTGFGPVPAVAPSAAPAAEPSPGEGSGSTASPATTPATTPVATPAATPAATPTLSEPAAAATSTPVAATTVVAPKSGSAAAPVSAPLVLPAAGASSAPAAGGVAASNDLSAIASDLELTFEQESWTEITDARGERLLFGLSSAGRHAKLRGELPISIVLGNADAVRLLVDGESYPIPAEGRQGKLVRFTVDVTED